MLSVGVHENVQFSKATKNDKNTLIVGFRKKETDKLAAISAGRFEEQEQDLMIFPPKMTKFDGGNCTAKEMLVRWGEITEPLEHIATQFMTKDKVKWDLFFNTGITPENVDAKLTDEVTAGIIYNNIMTQFINWMKPFVNNAKLFRLVLIRSSKAKHYPKLRTRYLNSQPFLEPMDVTPSKVKFSTYEIENGLNNPNPAGGAQQTSQADATEADALFANTPIES